MTTEIEHGLTARASRTHHQYTDYVSFRVASSGIVRGKIANQDAARFEHRPGRTLLLRGPYPSEYQNADGWKPGVAKWVIVELVRRATPTQTQIQRRWPFASLGKVCLRDFEDDELVLRRVLRSLKAGYDANGSAP